MEYRNGSFTVLKEFVTPFAIIKLQAFTHSNSIWVIVHHIQGRNESVHLYAANTTAFISKQLISLSRGSVIDGTTYRQSFYLVVAELPDVEAMDLSQNYFLLLYEWKDSQFDEVVRTKFEGSKSLVVWEIDGVLYIATCRNGNSFAPVYIYSPIMEDKVQYVLLIETDSYELMKHFSIGNDHYLAFVKDFSVELFLLSGDQFLLKQKLNVNVFAKIIDIFLLELEDHDPILIVASEVMIQGFKQDSSSYFTNVMKHMFRKDSDFINFAIFSSVDFLQSSKNLFLKQIFGSVIQFSADFGPLQSCVHHLQNLISIRDDLLENFMSNKKKIWFLNNQVEVNASVLVTGNVKAVGHELTKVGIIQVRSGSFAVPVDHVKKDISAHEKTMFSVQNRTLLKAKRQEMKGSMKFSKPLHVQNLTILNARNLLINGLLPFKLNSSLKIWGNQSFTSFVTINSSLVAWNVKMNGALNYKYLNDLVLLKGGHISTGKIVFQDLMAGEIKQNKGYTLNNLSLKLVVCTVGEQNIKGNKRFTNLIAEKVCCNFKVNMGNFSDLIHYTVFLDEEQEIGSELSFYEAIFANHVQVHGSVNGVSLTQLVNSAVRKSIPQVISGQKVFLSSMDVSNAHVKGKINDVLLEHVIDKVSHQNIHGNIHLENIETFKKISSFGINNGNLSEAVLRWGNQHVEGKTRLTAFSVSNVHMSPGTKLNSVDPSEMKFSLPKTMKMFEKMTWQTISVEDLRVNTSFPLLELQKLVWLKSQFQEISVPVNCVKFKLSDVILKVIKHHAFPQSFIPIRGYAFIDSSKIFGRINAKQIIQTDGSLLLGKMKVSADEVLSLNNLNGVISGIKTTNNLVIKGDVSIAIVNKLNISGIISSDAYGIMKGGVFTTVYCSDVLSEQISLKFMGGNNFIHFNEQAVKLRKRLPKERISVSNKKFSVLYGMAVLGAGSLNNFILKKIWKKIVTLNTFQSVSSKEFASVTAEHVNVPGSVNGIALVDVVARIVMSDNGHEAIAITGKKHFTGNALAEKYLLLESVNGVHISSLQSDVMSKSLKNEIIVTMDFTSVICRSLQASFNKKIDDVPVRNFVSLVSNKVFDFPVHLKSAHLYKNIIVHAANNCNLSLIFQNSLYYTKSNVQYINAEVSMGSLKVQNLHAIYLNGIDLDSLRTISLLTDELISGPIDFKNLEVDILNLKDSILNKVNATSIFVDTVLKFSDQHISGKKRLPNLTVNSVEAVALKSLDICGIDLLKLENCTVKKSGLQEIKSRIIFNSLDVEIVSVNAMMNGIRLPEDVILTDTPELIFSSTIWNSTVFIDMDLNTRGRSDGVHLVSVEEKVVQLDRDETLHSEIIFIDDSRVEGGIHVKEHVNGIQVNAIVTMGNDISVEGQKWFGDVEIVGDVTVKNEVNNVDLLDFIENVCKKNCRFSLSEIVFESIINISSLIVNENINSVSLRDLSSKMLYRSDVIHSDLSMLKFQTVVNGEAIAHQQEQSKFQFTAFAYFEIYQHISVQKALKFLPLQQVSSREASVVNNLMLWFEECGNVAASHPFLEKHPNPCCKAKTMEMSIEGNFLISNRIYHSKTFNFSLTSSNVLGISVIKSNDEECETSGNDAAVLIEFGNGTKSFVSKIYFCGGRIANVKVLEIDGKIYIVMSCTHETALADQGILVIKYYSAGSYWMKIQHLLGDIISFDVMNKNSIAYLAVGYNCSSCPSTLIYQWNSHNEIFFPVLNVSGCASDDILWVNKGEEMFLFLASETSLQNSNSVHTVLEPLKVFKISDGIFLNQTLNARGISSLATYSFLGNMFVIAVCPRHHSVFVLQWKSYNGFQVVQRITVRFVQNAATFRTAFGHVMLAVTSSATGPKVFKMVYRGNINNQVH